MMTVESHAAPAPDTRTPSNHAWGVKAGSCPTVWVNTHAARTEIVNCNQTTGRKIGTASEFNNAL